MNKIDFTNVGGFPLTANILGELQKAYSVLNALGNIIGELTIISGCDIVGGNISDGVVYIAGEVLAFQGGAIQTKVIIKEDVTNYVFQDGNSKPVLKTRYAKFGTGVTFYTWADFKRGTKTSEIPAIITGLTDRLDVLEAKASIFQAGGGMLFWNKPANQIPTGWQEVVAWRGRIAVGLDASQAEFDVLGKTGGSKTHTNTIAEMAEHNHDWQYGTQSDDSGTGASFDEFTLKPGNIPAADSGNPTGKTGGGDPYSIMNPYRTVLFIECIIP